MRRRPAESLLVGVRVRRPMGGSHEEAPDDGGLLVGDRVGGEQRGERLAEVVHLPVQAPDVAARLLQHPRRRAPVSAIAGLRRLREQGLQLGQQLGDLLLRDRRRAPAAPRA